MEDFQPMAFAGYHVLSGIFGIYISVEYALGEMWWPFSFILLIWFFFLSLVWGTLLYYTSTKPGAQP